MSECCSSEYCENLIKVHSGSYCSSYLRPYCAVLIAENITMVSNFRFIWFLWKLGSKAISIIVWAVFGFTIHDLAVSMQFAVIPIGTLACISTRYPNYWVLRSRSIIFGFKNHDQTRVCAVYVFIRLGDSVVIYVVVLKSSNCRER